MKKLFVFVAVFAMFSGLTFATQLSTLTETAQQGNMRKTWTLQSNGLFTEATCVMSAQGSDQLLHCASMSKKLTKAELKKATSAMHASRAQLISTTDLSRSVSSGRQDASKSIGTKVGTGVSRAYTASVLRNTGMPSTYVRGIEKTSYMSLPD